MAERYQRIYSLPPNLYTKDSPIVIRAGALLRDTFLNSVLAQLKIENISNKQLNIVKVEIHSLDTEGNVIDAPIPFSYSGLKILYGENFGTQIPIPLRNTTTAIISVQIKEVLFADGEVWANNGNKLKTIKEQESISSFITNQYALAAYQRRYRKNHKLYAPIFTDAYWLCTCGSLCMSSSNLCHTCGTTKHELSNIDFQNLTIEGQYITSIQLSVSKKIDTLNEALSLAQLCVAQNFPNAYELSQKIKKNIEQVEKEEEHRRLVEEQRKEEERLAEERLAEERRKEEERLAEERRIKQEKREARKIKTKRILKITSLVTLIAIVIGLAGYFGAYPLISTLSGNYGVSIRMYQTREFKIPEGTETIKAGAFTNCTSLTYITIPTSVKTIDSYAFFNCFGINEISLHSGIEYVASDAFEGCNIEQATLPSHALNSINKEKIKLLTINGGDTIPSAIFKNATRLTEVSISDSITSIGFTAFLGCSNLKTVRLGKGITKIDTYAFSTCTKIKDVYYAGSEEDWNKIEFADGNDHLKNAMIHFDCAE